MDGDVVPTRLVELITPAIRDVLVEHRALDIVPIDAVVTAVARSLRNPPTGNFRRRLIEESGGSPTCWICRLPIPLGAAHDAPESFSIDHVIPRREGGAALGYQNLRAAHRLCNAMRDVPAPHSKKWRARADLLVRTLRELEGHERHARAR